jgi:charged multivesicular body protein 6
VNEVEYKKVEQDVMKGLQTGNNVLKELQKELNIEAVEKLMDETADAIAYQKVTSVALFNLHPFDH